MYIDSTTRGTDQHRCQLSGRTAIRKPGFGNWPGRFGNQELDSETATAIRKPGFGNQGNLDSETTSARFGNTSTGIRKPKGGCLETRILKLTVQFENQERDSDIATAIRKPGFGNQENQDSETNGAIRKPRARFGNCRGDSETGVSETKEIRIRQQPQPVNRKPRSGN